MCAVVSDAVVSDAVVRHDAHILAIVFDIRLSTSSAMACQALFGVISMKCTCVCNTYVTWMILQDTHVVLSVLDVSSIEPSYNKVRSCYQDISYLIQQIYTLCTIVKFGLLSNIISEVYVNLGFVWATRAAVFCLCLAKQFVICTSMCITNRLSIWRHGKRYQLVTRINAVRLILEIVIPTKRVF